MHFAHGEWYLTELRRALHCLHTKGISVACVGCIYELHSCVQTAHLSFGWRDVWSAEIIFPQCINGIGLLLATFQSNGFRI